MKNSHLMILAASIGAGCSVLASIGTQRWILAIIGVASAVMLGLLSTKNARKQINSDPENTPPSAH
jgi:hypothetical protein